MSSQIINDVPAVFKRSFDEPDYKREGFKYHLAHITLPGKQKVLRMILEVTDFPLYTHSIVKK